MPNFNPRHAYVVSFDDDNKDLYYFLSHDDIELSSDIFTEQTSGTANTLRSVWYEPTVGYWIACGDSGTILKSFDGETWTAYDAGSPSSTYSLRTVKFWKGIWWIVGYGDNSTPPTILKSTDGESWTPIDLGVSPQVPGSLVTIGFSDDLMIFGGFTRPFSNTSAFTVTTPDGINFAINYYNTESGIYGIEYSKKQNIFGICGSGDITDTDPYFALSVDGVTHVEYETNMSYSIFSVAFNGYQWVTISGLAGMEAKYSAKGRVWRAATFDATVTNDWPWRTTYDNKGHLYVAGGDNSTEGKLFRSVDNGKTYQQLLSSTTPIMYRKAMQGQDYWIAVGNGGKIYKSGIAKGNIFNGTLLRPSTTSQSLNPIRANASIGNISFSFSDDNQLLTRLLSERLKKNQGLKAKRVQHWVGEEGDVWPTDYNLLQTQQFYNSIGWSDNAYHFNAQDIQRSELKNLFTPKKTTLTSSLGLTGLTVYVNSSVDFSLIQHGGGFSDAPNRAVAYLLIQKEIIRVSAIPSTTFFTIDFVGVNLSAAAVVDDITLSITDHSQFRQSGHGYVVSGSPGVEYPIKWTGKSDSPHQLTGVTGVTAGFDSGSVIVDLQGRGVLGTKLAEHTVDTDQAADKRTKVEEYIYYEMPAVQFLYYVLTGTLYGNSPAFTAPAHHTLGISAADWIATSEFTSIGSDLWDTSDDTLGFPLRFEGLKKTNAKKFIEDQILLVSGLFTPILETGELGLRRMHGVVSDAAYSRVLDESNILKGGITNTIYDLDEIHNNFLVNWNYNTILKEYTRDVSLTDTVSIARHGESKELIINARGLSGSIHTDSTIGNLFNMFRDRHAGPPFKATIRLAYSERTIRVGDIVRIKVDNIPEFTDQNSDYESLNLSVEVQKVRIDYVTGVVTISVFGSTERSAPLVIGNPSLDDTFYTSEGSPLSGVSTIVGSSSGGTFTITANSSVTGVADLNSASATADNDLGTFYVDENFKIAEGVTLTITDNVEIRYKGVFTNNGTIDGIGGGLTGGASGQEGHIGSTKGGGGISFVTHNILGLDHVFLDSGVTSTDSDVTSVTNTTVGPYNIVNNNTSISGLPGNLRGSSGGKGGDIVENGTLVVTSPNGADGGAGLRLIGRGAVGGVNSSINLSGNDGVDGGTYDAVLGIITFVAGSSAGGYPGGLVIVQDGGTVTETITPYFIANLGQSNVIGTPLINGGASTFIHSSFIGFQAESKIVSNLYVHYLTESQTAAIDTPSESTLPTAINVSPRANTLNTVNIIGLELSADAPAGVANYKAARIYIRQQNTQGWYYAGEVASGQEVVFQVPADGTTYEVKAHSLSITNVESTDFIERVYTVASTLLTVMPPGNEIVGVGNLSGNAADETLAPNSFFESDIEGTWDFLAIGTAPAVLPTIQEDSPTDGRYLFLPSDTNSPAPGYGYGGKTFRLLPNKKYRFRVRVKRTASSPLNPSPVVGHGFYFSIQYKSSFVEPITVDNRDSFYNFIDGAEEVITTSYVTYEFDYVVPDDANYANIVLVNWSQNTLDFSVLLAEPLSLFATHEVADYGDETTFVHLPFWQSTESIGKSILGAGSSVVASPSGYLTLTADRSAVLNKAYVYQQLRGVAGDMSWSVNRSLKVVLLFSTPDGNSDAYFYTGSNSTSYHFGFLRSGAQWKAVNRNGGASTTTNITVAQEDKLEAVLDNSTSPREIRFYINGVQVAKHTTDVPSGTTDALRMYDAGVIVSGLPSPLGTTPTLNIGEFKFLYEGN